MALSNPLEKRFESLPLILCGPIPRRVDAQIVSVWVALKEARKIKLHLYTGYQDGSKTLIPDFSSDFQDTLKVGKHLHIAVVTLPTKGILRNKEVYSYDLHFYKDVSDPEPSSLHHLGLLKAPVLLGFKENQLPSIQFFPEKLKDFRLSHGSCRKPHGKGRDGLAALAEVMKSDFLDIERTDDPKVRPHYFFHTGDQIYADDSSNFLMEHYTDVGNFLLQKIEMLPFPKISDDYHEKQNEKGKQFIWMKAVTAALPPARRATNFYTGFTGKQRNHLYSFAEFSAAYLMQWCDVLWPKELQTIPELIESKIGENPKTADYLFPLKDWEKETKNTGKGESNEFWKDRKKEIRRVKEFKNDLPAARRAMANMPNIMTFDDHDVTDDWYLNGRWTKRVLGNRLGKSIISNGLLAFALFQAWGNDPIGWSENPLLLLLQSSLPTDFPSDKKQDLQQAIQKKLQGISEGEEDPINPKKETEDEVTEAVKIILETHLTPANLGFTDANKEEFASNIRTQLLTQIITSIPRKLNAKNELLTEITAFVEGMGSFETTPENLIVDETTGGDIQDWAALRSLRIYSNLGFDDFDKPKVTWHFSYQLGPTRLIALDTRTRRDFSAGMDFPPNLIRKKALGEQISSAELPQGTEAVIVISGAPILGLATIESIGQTMAPRIINVMNLFKGKIDVINREVPEKGEEAQDVEHWSLHTEGYEALLKKLSKFKKVICLSGDVHYGITSEMDYWEKDKSKASRIVQMVSSAMKNMNPEDFLEGLLPTALTQYILTKGLNREMSNLTLVGWEKDTGKLKLKRQVEIGEFRDARPGEFPLRLAYALGKKPVHLPLRDWPLGKFPTKADPKDQVILPRIVMNEDGPEPSYIWRLNFVQDTRTDKERFGALGSAFEIEPDADVPVDFNAANYKSSLDQMIRRNTFFSRFHFSRAVNWFSNVGMVHFKEGPNEELTVIHSLYSYPIYLPEPHQGNPGTFESPYFQHEVSLEQKPVSAKPLYPVESKPV